MSSKVIHLLVTLSQVGESRCISPRCTINIYRQRYTGKHTVLRPDPFHVSGNSPIHGNVLSWFSRYSTFDSLYLEKGEAEKEGSLPVRRISFFPDIEHHSWEDYFLLPAESPGTSVFSSNIAWQYPLEETVLLGTKPYFISPYPHFLFLY